MHWVFTDECSIYLNDIKTRTFFRSKPQDKNDTSHYRSIPKKSVRLNIFGILTSQEIKIFKLPQKFTSNYYLKLLRDGGVADYVKNNLEEPIYYLQDSAKVHMTASVRNYLRTKFQLVVNWPTYSPDLNIIEKVWAILKDKLRLKVASLEESEEPESEEQIFAICNEILKQISPETIGNLYKGMVVKMKNVIQIEGERTPH